MVVRDALVASAAVVARKAEPGLDRDAFIAVGLHHLNEAMARFQAGALLRRARDQGIVLAAPPRSRLLGPLIAGREPGLPSWLAALEGVPPGPFGRVPVVLRRGVREVQMSGILALRPARPGDPVALHPSPLIRAHARATRRRVRLQYPAEFLTRPGPPGPGLPGSLREVVADGVATAWRAGGEADVPAAETLDEVLDRSSAAAAGHLGRLAGAALPKELWTGSGGELWTRLLRTAVLRAGGTVVGHDHAPGVGYLVYDVKLLNDLVACTRYMTFTEAQAAGLEARLASGLGLQDPPPAVQVLPHRTTGALTLGPVRRRRSGPRQGRVRCVVYPSTFYNGDRVHFAVQVPDLVQVDWEARLFAHLGTWGFDVLHKPHPGSIAPPPLGLAKLPRVRLRTDPFEQVMHLADAVVATTPQTTVLVSVLRAGLPLVFVDLGLFAWAPSARRLFERRAAVVPGWFDAEHRIQVEWDALRAALEEAPRRLDAGFEQAYLGPPLPGEVAP